MQRTQLFFEMQVPGAEFMDWILNSLKPQGTLEGRGRVSTSALRLYWDDSTWFISRCNCDIPDLSFLISFGEWSMLCEKNHGSTQQFGFDPDIIYINILYMI